MAFEFFKTHFEKFDKIYEVFTGKSMRNQNQQENNFDFNKFLEDGSIDDLIDDDDDLFNLNIPLKEDKKPSAKSLS